ncbi:class I SAM-dependent methyltransferase [Nocardiopsis halotolerans]|uniref:class I SAM-dependent methyltransferase n=1 Tax=Nocardiopsis halotolerans TaxID=124252 RepID=UPI0003629EAD|nr:methyltransferase domain-containing protein [Nocardiopsis halotolerans]
MADSTADLFDSVADVYDASVPFFTTFARRLVAWAEPPRGARLLDLGAGRGAVSVAVSEALGPSCSILAVDVSPRMVGALAALPLPRLRARVMDAQALDLPDASRDTVLSGFALHILPDPGAALRGVARVLAPGAALAFSTPGPSADGGWWSRYGTIFDEFAALADAPAGMGGPPPDWGELAEQAGLRYTRTAATELSLPLDGPEAHWRWLLSHGNRWLHDALGPADRRAFERRVLHSLAEHHPTRGHSLIAGAVLHEMVRP